MKIQLNNKKIIIATHLYATGPATDLKEYLLENKCHQFLFIGHPLFFDKKLRGSGYEYYQDSKLRDKYDPETRKMPMLLSYLKDFLLNIFWTFRFGRNADLYIGSDNLNAIAGVVLQKLGLVKKTVYYVIDYNPKRFKNPILNKIYHKIDQICVANCDETWNLSPRMESARKKYFNFSGGNQKLVPVGIWFERFKPVSLAKVKKHTLVFMGHILEKQGVQYVLDAIPLIIDKIPDFKFLVVGGGEYLDTLKEKTKDLGIGKYVSFTGFVKDHKQIEKMLGECGVAVALYEKYVDGDLSFTYFSDPGKIKSYLAAGLPILVSDVPYIASEIEKKECGKVISLDRKIISSAVTELMKNDKKYANYRKNAISFAEKYDWNNIFYSVLKTL